MKVQSYDDWKQEQKPVPCVSCSGDGEYVCDDGWEYICQHCSGTGELLRDSKSDYFNAIVSEINKVCVWTRGDFLSAVGPFVREHRSGN
jgi:hypothetical protein